MHFVRRQREKGIGREMSRHVDHLTARDIMALKSNGKAPKEIATIAHVSLWTVYRTLRPGKKSYVSDFCHCGKKRRAPNQRYCFECHARAFKRWRESNPLTGERRLRAIARSYLKVYVMRGKIKKMPCEKCGENEVHGHHSDYSKPLEVRWLCKKHHLAEHGKISHDVA